jgi:rubredoxin
MTATKINPDMDFTVDLVDPQFACPKCGEREIDYLICQDDGSVICSMCGTVYDPPFGG